jgi:hypothetical protein
MQITAIVLYGMNWEKRVLPFKPGSVNIITGKSKTGKSVIGDIIDYCFGSSSCSIAEGYVRENVAWYGLQIIHNDEYMFIARENPPQGQASTNKCCYLIGEKEIPDNLYNLTPIDNDGLEKILSAKLGISENLFDPPPNQSRQSLTANIRHTLFYCIQNQDEIASQRVLFHRQGEPFITQAIKDTLPYFLGVTNENALALESERSLLKREATILRRNIEEVDALEGSGLHRAIELLAEAKEVGLLSDSIQVDLADYCNVRDALQLASKGNVVSIKTSGMDRISMLQTQLERIQQEIDRLSIDIRNTEEFLGQVKGYGTEVNHQKTRLESIGLFEQLDFDSAHCPLCFEPVESPLPSAQQIRDSITRLSNKLETVSRERPHLRQHVDNLIGKRQELREQSDAIELEINAIYEENKEALRLKDLNARRGRVLGRISLWLESVVISDGMDGKRRKLDSIEARIEKIDSLLDAGEVEERKLSVVSRLSAMMSKWAGELELEHSEYPYRLDLNKLTVIVDRDRPVPLQQLGSGSNWLGCHLITLFALHTFFRNQQRPVPGFLFLDQPSQVYFPPETDKQDMDSQEIRMIYKFIFERINELHPDMQVIIVDHADINEDYFQNAVIEKWWNGAKLVPTDWSQQK